MASGPVVELGLRLLPAEVLLLFGLDPGLFALALGRGHLFFQHPCGAGNLVDREVGQALDVFTPAQPDKVDYDLLMIVDLQSIHDQAGGCCPATTPLLRHPTAHSKDQQLPGGVCV